MITSSVKELNNARAKVAELEQALAKELASLPSAYGFNSLNSFVAAIAAAARKGRAGRPKKAARPKSRKRATITDAVRTKVGKLVKSGNTGSQIAKTLGISLPSVQNIKKALGLVKSARKASPDRKVKKAPAKQKATFRAKKKLMPPKKKSASVPKAAPAVVDAPPTPAA